VFHTTDQFRGTASVNIGFPDVGILGIHKHVGRKWRVDCVWFFSSWTVS